METQSAGPVADQAALDGLLRPVCDLGMPLLSVDLVAGEKPGGAEATYQATHGRSEE